jgi:hypothetical protein
MEWLNLKLSILNAPEYMRSGPIERATWLSLLAYCADQENGGVIANCEEWKDRTWQQTCGVTLREVKTETRLWSWENGSLIVWSYPAEKEQIVKQKRASAASGGKASGESRREAYASANASAYAPANGEAKPKHMLQQMLERNGKEGEGKGKEQKLERESSAGATPDVVVIEKIATAYPRQDAPIEVRQLIAQAIDSGTPGEQILAAVQQCAELIRSAPGGSGNRYVPTARAFFQNQQWRSPEGFTSRWEKETKPGSVQRMPDNTKPGEIPTVHTKLKPIDWRNLPDPATDPKHQPKP